MKTTGALRGGFVAILAMLLAILSAAPPAACREADSRPRTTGHVMDNEAILRVLFHPTQCARNAAPEHATDIDIPVEGEGGETTLLAARLFTHSPAAPTLIFFHGNGEIIPDYDEIAPHYLALGLNFAVCEYRGYGWSGGSPLVSTFLPDAEAVFVFLLDWLKRREYTGPIALMGRSLGSACAIDLAARHQDTVRALVIESGFAQTLPLAKALGLDLEALGIGEEQGFNNAQKIAAITKPTLILHGQFDQLIPIWQAEKLHAECGARTKELQIVPGADHNSLIAAGGPYYFTAIGNFVGKATGVAPDWRARRRAFKAARQAGETNP